MRVAVVARWYPSQDDPVNGIFVREHAVALALEHDVTVIADDPPRRAADDPRRPPAVAARAGSAR